MTSMLVEAADELTGHPLDVVEELVTANEWIFQRADENEMLIEIAGRWCAYRLSFIWQADMSALHFSCSFDMKIPPLSSAAVTALLANVNERLWIGHFDLSGDDRTLAFRHSSLLRGIGTISAEIVEDLVELGVLESDRYYPAFQLVMWGGKSPDEALTSAILDPVGEA